MSFPDRIKTAWMVLRCYEKWELDAHMEILGSRRILEKAGFQHHGETPSNDARCGHLQGCDEFYRLKNEDWNMP